MPYHNHRFFLSKFSRLKVHKHEIFINTFLLKPNPYGPKGLQHKIFENRIRFGELFDF